MIIRFLLALIMILSLPILNTYAVQDTMPVAEFNTSNIAALSKLSGYTAVLLKDNTLWYCEDKAPNRADVSLGEFVKIADNIKSFYSKDSSILMLTQSSDLMLLLFMNNKSEKPTLILGGVKKVAIGGLEGDKRFFLALMKDGTVNAWGNNISGQLGQSANQDLVGKPIVVAKGASEIAAGDNASFYITKNGDVYGAGNNKEYVLDPNKADSLLRTYAKVSSNMIYLESSACLTAGINKKKQLVVWGSGRDEANQTTLKISPITLDVKTKYIGLDNKSVYVVDDTGKLFHYPAALLGTTNQSFEIDTQVSYLYASGNQVVYMKTDGSCYLITRSESYMVNSTKLFDFANRQQEESIPVAAPIKSHKMSSSDKKVALFLGIPSLLLLGILAQKLLYHLRYDK